MMVEATTCLNYFVVLVFVLPLVLTVEGAGLQGIAIVVGHGITQPGGIA